MSLRPQPTPPGGLDIWRPRRPAVEGLSAGAIRPVEGLRRTLKVDVDTALVDPAAVHGPHQFRVTLPLGYGVDPARRYPVLYLLHGGDGGRSSQWTTGGGEAERLTDGLDLVVVTPDGGKVGWYTDWADRRHGRQDWETFHLTALVPWVDANLDTVADRRGRAVAGISMGGFGALRYAQRRPDLFSYGASLSGALTFRHPLVRATIYHQTIFNRLGLSGPFGRGRAALWSAEDPLNHLDALRSTRIALYAGHGDSILDPIERVVAATTRRMSEALDIAGIAHRYWEPAPTRDRRHGSEHAFGHWNAALGDLAPDLMAHLDPPRSETGATTGNPPGSDQPTSAGER